MCVKCVDVCEWKSKCKKVQERRRGGGLQRCFWQTFESCQSQSTRRTWLPETRAAPTEVITVKSGEEPHGSVTPPPLRQRPPRSLKSIKKPSTKKKNHIGQYKQKKNLRKGLLSRGNDYQV